MVKNTDFELLLNKLETLEDLVGLKSVYKDPITILDDVIEQLTKINYIPFPISFSTVDIVPYYIDVNKELYILLGRKPGQTKWQFPGGFRDPRETNQVAAQREFSEEVTLLKAYNSFKPLFDVFVDDRRYENSVHKITTHVFCVELSFIETTQAQAGDDLEEIKIFSLNNLKQNKDKIIREVHLGLFEKASVQLENLIA